jgi:hypothetical protein
MSIETSEPVNLDPAKVMQFVSLSSAFGKKALDELAVFREAENSAKAASDELVTLMLQNGLIHENQKQAATDAIANPIQRVEMFKQAVAKLAASRARTKTAEMGGPSEDPNSSGRSSAGTHDANWSLKSGYVGERTSVKKASDVAWLRGLGLEE